MNYINHFITEEYLELRRRVKKYMTYSNGMSRRELNSRFFDTNTNEPIDGVWLAAIKKVTLRTMNIPTEIVNDFMVSKGLWEEE